MAKPIVATRVGGIPEIIEDNGFLVEPKSKNELKEKILLLMRDSVLRENFGNKSHELVNKKYKWDIIARKTLGLFEEGYDKKCV